MATRKGFFITSVLCLLLIFFVISCDPKDVEDEDEVEPLYVSVQNVSYTNSNYYSMYLKIISSSTANSF